MGVGDAAETKRVWRRKSGGGADTLAPLRVRPRIGRAWKTTRPTFVSEALYHLARASTIPSSCYANCPAFLSRHIRS